VNKNPDAVKQYLTDRIGRAGAELCEIMGSETAVLPVTGEDKLYVAVGTLGGIAQVAGKSFDKAAGNTNKAVLTDEQIVKVWQEMPGGPNGWLKEFGFSQFARAIEAAVLTNASKAVVAEPVGKTVAMPGSGGGFTMCAFNAVDVPVGTDLYLAAPAPADNPSTAGAAKGGDTPRVDALMARWDDDGATRGSAFCELRNLARELESSLAAPALNPSEVRDEALEEAALTCEQIGTDWLDADDAHKNFAADYLAKAIRALKSAAIKAADQQGALGEKGGEA
jgi:hypothetical protein